MLGEIPTSPINNGLKQGDSSSSLLFNILLDMVIKESNIDLVILTNQSSEMSLAYAATLLKQMRCS